MINRSGPNIEPCGTPHFTDLTSDCVPSKQTVVDRSDNFQTILGWCLCCHMRTAFKKVCGGLQCQMLF